MVSWPTSTPRPEPHIAAAFDQGAFALADELRALDTDGNLRSDSDPDGLAAMLLATLQVGFSPPRCIEAPALKPPSPTFLALSIGS